LNVLYARSRLQSNYSFPISGRVLGTALLVDLSTVRCH